MKNNFIHSPIDQNIDIWFRANEEEALLDVVTSDGIPHAYKQYEILGSAIRYQRYAFGSIFSQRLSVRKQTFWLHLFELNKQMCLRPCTNSLLISLIYFLQGNIQYEANGEKVTIPERRYQLYGLSSAIACRVTLQRGVTMAFQMTVPHEALLEMGKVYHTDETIKALFEFKFKGVWDPALFKISAGSRKHIQKILNQKIAKTPLEQFARQACWEEHLSALFSLYIEDKNRRAVLKELHDKNKLRLADLPPYIEKHLAYMSSSNQDALHIANVVHKVHLTHTEFKRAMNQEYGCSWKQLVHSIRMTRAKQLLKSESSESISEIASMLGYSFPTHFIRAFKLHFGKSPTEFRRTAK